MKSTMLRQNFKKSWKDRKVLDGFLPLKLHVGNSRQWVVCSNGLFHINECCTKMLIDGSTTTIKY